MAARDIKDTVASSGCRTKAVPPRFLTFRNPVAPPPPKTMLMTCSPQAAATQARQGSATHPVLIVTSLRGIVGNVDYRRDSGKLFTRTFWAGEK
jgi:hypothetical protein